MPYTGNHNMDQARARVREAQETVQHMILHTPTSDKRNHLTEANLHLMMAADALKRAERQP